MKIKIDYRFEDGEEQLAVSAALQELGVVLWDVAQALLYSAEAEGTPKADKYMARAQLYMEKFHAQYRRKMPRITDPKLRNAVSVLYRRANLKGTSKKGIARNLYQLGRAFKKFGLVVARIPTSTTPINYRPRWR